MNKKCGYVYILTNNHHTVLYTGVTSDLEQRIWRHRNFHYAKAFTKKYNIHKLVYFERHDRITDAIKREKQIKAGSRKKKIALIESINPQWRNLL